MQKSLSRVVLALSLVGLGACETVPTTPTTQDIYWKTGTTSVQRRADFTPCEVEALQQVPRAMAVGQTPTYTTPTYSTPVYSSCNASGAVVGYSGGYNYQSNCTASGGNSYGGQTFGGQIYSYDANERLRKQVGEQCLSRKGWQLISFPTCTLDQTRQGVISAVATALPRPETVLCVTADSGYVLKDANP